MARLLDTTQNALTKQERLSSELRTVAEVSTVTSTIMERDRLLQNVVDLTKTSFALYHAHIYLLNEGKDTLSLVAGSDQVGRLMTLEESHIPIYANSILTRAARTREPIIVNRTRHATDFLPHPLLPNTRAELAIPMIVGDRLVGVLDVLADVENRFGEQDVLIMRTLASQIAVAVQNAEQYAEQVQTAEKLREVERLKSEFLASMSHELRTPLNSIIGFADVLLEGLDGDLNDRMEQDVRLIRDSGDHLRNLIGDILDMSKIEAGKMDLRYEEIDMRQMAQDIIATANPLAHEKQLKLGLNLSDDLFNIHADRTRLRQIMWNIMGNAIKFTQKGSVTLAMQTQENNLLVSIRDTGIGISSENIPIVFEQFRQIDGSLNRMAEGTGLGMPITKKLVEIHGGEIWVESVIGIGTTFWFTIPRFPAPQTGTGPLPNVD
jgi:signal transduction histidine kinase